MATVASRNGTQARNVVQVDIEELLARFHNVVNQAELAASTARDFKRLGLQLDSAAREIVGKTVAAEALGLPVQAMAETLTQLGGDLLKAAENSASGEIEAQGLRYLLAREVVQPQIKLEAQGLLKRWDDVSKQRQTEESEWYDFDFRVRVTKKGKDGEAKSGERTGVTRWNNLVARGKQVFGAFSQADRRQWLIAKKELANDVTVVEVGDWVFERL